MSSSKGFLSVLLLVFVSMATIGLAVDFCISDFPTVGLGASCSGEVSCQGLLYCNNQSVCALPIQPGSTCTPSDACAYGSACKGTTGSTVCVQYANPGSSCSNSQTSLLPYCPPTFTCDPSSNTCIYGGTPNDTCSKNLDCASLICQNAKCVGFPEAASCLSTAQCAPGLFCQGYTGAVNGTCVPLLTTGTCNNGDECAVGYYCERPSVSDVRQCQKAESKKPGDYCGNTPQICSSHRCSNSHCAKSSGDSCYNNGQCAYDQACSCSGSSVYDGIGKCVGGSCWGQYMDLWTCMTTNCNSVWYYQYVYSGSCANNYCKGQINSYFNCANDATSLTVSFFLLSLLACFSSFFKF